MSVEKIFLPRTDEDEEKQALYIDDELEEKTRREKKPKKFHLDFLILSIFLVAIVSLFVLVLILISRTPKSLSDEKKLVALDESLPCVKIGSSCLCPASFVRWSKNENLCVPSSSRCLKLCEKNPHCSCYRSRNSNLCQNVTRHWIENQLKSGAVQTSRSNIVKTSLPETVEQFFKHHQKSSIKLFFSNDRRTAITIDASTNDYLLNEHWNLIDTNSTDQYLIYSQVDVETHSCILSSIRNDGSVLHGSAQTCPGNRGQPPYFFASACQDVLVLWRGSSHQNFLEQLDFSTVFHNFETILPTVAVLLDPFHRYYSLYDDSMIEIKDLAGNVLVQFFTQIVHPKIFRFVDARGTLLVGNQTHQQIFTSTDPLSWIDF